MFQLKATQTPLPDSPGLLSEPVPPITPWGPRQILNLHNVFGGQDEYETLLENKSLLLPSSGGSRAGERDGGSFRGGRKGSSQLDWQSVVSGQSFGRGGGSGQSSARGSRSGQFSGRGSESDQSLTAGKQSGEFSSRGKLSFRYGFSKTCFHLITLFIHVHRRSG